MWTAVHTWCQQERAYAQGKFFFADLVAYMTSGPICAYVLGRVDAVRAWRQLCGPTDPVRARQQKPHWCAHALLPSGLGRECSVQVGEC